MRHSSPLVLFTVPSILLLASCSGRVSDDTPRVVSVAQSGTADVVGSDDVALQKAADLLRPGDTLSIGPGTFEMSNSLFVPSGVTVRGAAGKTILRKSRGVESLLAEDGDYGESALLVTDPEKFRPGMGITVLDDTLKSAWDVSVSTVKGVDGRMLRIDPEFTGNTIARNGVSGVYFRNETLLNSGHRNIFRKNKVLDNGGAKTGYGFQIEPKAGDLVIEDNQVADTRATGRTQRYGIYKAAGAGAVVSRNNVMSGHLDGDYVEEPPKKAVP